MVMIFVIIFYLEQCCSKIYVPDTNFGGYDSLFVGKDLEGLYLIYIDVKSPKTSILSFVVIS